MADFFKLNKTKLILFVLFIIISFFVLDVIEIFPCEKVEFNDCGGGVISRVNSYCFSPIFPRSADFITPDCRSIITSHYLISYIIYFFLLLVIPYLLACALGSIFKKMQKSSVKNKNKTYK